jgi:hypothetical protein
MKSKTGYSIAVCALVLSLSPVAHADSLSLHFSDRNVGVGVNVGYPPVRYVAVAPEPEPHCAPRYSGYRQGWAAPVYVQPVGYWGYRDYYREAPRWERHRRNEWREQDRRDYHERGDDRREYEGRRYEGNERGRDWR